MLRVLEQQLAALIESGQVQVHLGTSVTQLVRDGDRVIGVETVDATGDVATIDADAVVLATGGYDANVELRNRFMPEHCHSVLVGCLDHATGDGLLMAEQIGAAVSADGIFLPVMGLIPDPHRAGHAVDYRDAFVEMAPAYRTPHEIWVNTAGRRFVAEDTTSPELRERALIDQPDNTMHVIFDAGVIADAPVSLIRNPAGRLDDRAVPRRVRDERLDHSRRNRRRARRRARRRPPHPHRERRRRTTTPSTPVADDLGRTTFPGRLDRGPFYAITTVAASILSRDGLAADTELRVLDASGAPIPGLYAVGEVLGNNKFAGDNYVGGMSITPALTLGRILGERLAGSGQTMTTQTMTTRRACDDRQVSGRRSERRLHRRDGPPAAPRPLCGPAGLARERRRRAVRRGGLRPVGSGDRRGARSRCSPPPAPSTDVWSCCRFPRRRPARHPWQADTGFIAINMYTRDIQVSHTELSAAGQTWVTPPATWRVPLGEQIVTVTQGFLRAPESTDIVFVEPAQARGTAAWDAEPDRHYTELTSVVCHVPDFEAETGFWGPDGLGLASWYDVSFTDPGLDEMAKLPSGTVMRLAFLAGATTARIEVTRMEDRTIGTDLRATQRTAQHVGHTGWLLEVHDLDAAVSRATELGGTVAHRAR